MSFPLILECSFWAKPLIRTERIYAESDPNTKEAQTCPWREFIKYILIFWESSFGKANLNWPSKFPYGTEGLAEGRGNPWRPESEGHLRDRRSCQFAALNTPEPLLCLFPAQGTFSHPPAFWSYPHPFRPNSNVTSSSQHPTLALQAKSESVFRQHFMCP